MCIDDALTVLFRRRLSKAMVDMGQDLATFNSQVLICTRFLK